ncbi:MAG: nucleotidyltransferase family protein [Oceanicaulis sp.]
MHTDLRLDLDHVKARLRECGASLRALGVTRITIFGSVARGEAGSGSDLDVMIGTRDPVLPAKNYRKIEAAIAQAVGAPVGLVTEAGTDGRLRQEIERDGVEAAL